MRADADERPVDRRLHIRQRRLFTDTGHQEIVHEMRGRSAMTSPLQERQMFRVLNGGWLRESTNRFWQQVRVVANFHPCWNLSFRERMRRRAPGVEHRILILDLLPFERLLRSIRIEALAILPRGREQAPRHFGTDIRITQLERRRLDRERTAVLRNERLVDAAR